MKVRKSKNKDFIYSLLNSEELSYEDYLKLKKLEDLYIKAKEKYKYKHSSNKFVNIELKKIQNMFENAQPLDICEDSFDFIAEDTPSYRRAKDFAQYMNQMNEGTLEYTVY